MFLKYYAHQDCIYLSKNICAFRFKYMVQFHMDQQISHLFVGPHIKCVGHVLGDRAEEGVVSVAKLMAGFQHRQKLTEGEFMHVFCRKQWEVKWQWQVFICFSSRNIWVDHGPSHQLCSCCRHPAEVWSSGPWQPGWRTCTGCWVD